MNNRIKAIMNNAENLHIAYEENKEFYKAGYNHAIEDAAKIAERSETNLTKIVAEDIKGLKK